MRCGPTCRCDSIVTEPWRACRRVSPIWNAPSVGSCISATAEVNCERAPASERERPARRASGSTVLMVHLQGVPMSDDDKTPLPAHAEMPEGEEAAPPGVRTMAIVRWTLILLMGVAAAAAWMSYAGVWKDVGHQSSEIFYCPMHPSVQQD